MIIALLWSFLELELFLTQKFSSVAGSGIL